MAVFGLIMFALAPQILGIFFKHSETIVHGVLIMRIFSVMLPFFGVMMMCEFVHTGVGLNSPTMVIYFINAWVLQVLPIFVMRQFFHVGETTVWTTIALAGVIGGILYYSYYRRGRWLTARV